MSSRFARTFTAEPRVPQLDLDDWIGQRSATFRFDYVDIITGYRTPVTPLKTGGIPTVSHDVGRTITRQLSNANFGVVDTSLINVIAGRIEPFMVFTDAEYPLGRYMFNNQTKFDWTSGTLCSCAMYDEGFIVDQQTSASFGAESNALNPLVDSLLQALLNGLPITVTIEPTTFTSSGAWPAGTSRGYIVEQLAIDGGYFSPWFDNTGVMRFIQAFDPATSVVTFDLDSGNRVLRGRATRTNDLIDAPNRFIVISNSANAITETIASSYDVPSSAPHSIANRGFVIAKTETRQLDTSVQAVAVARNLGLRQTIFERVELYTAPDPRHDGYDVLRWRGENWLELAWSLPLIEGSEMQHIARKVYSQ